MITPTSADIQSSDRPHHAALNRPDDFENCVVEITSNLADQLEQSLQPMADLLRESAASREEVAEAILLGLGMAMEACIDRAAQPTAPKI